MKNALLEKPVQLFPICECHLRSALQPDHYFDLVLNSWTNMIMTKVTQKNYSTVQQCLMIVILF